MYYTYTAKDLPATKTSYIVYVDSLRAHFTIRIEVNKCASVNNQIVLAHQIARAELETYLADNLPVEKYHIQTDTGYHGLFYTWFMDKEDAVAFALRFGGKVI